MDLELKFEKCLRLCNTCDFFDHDGDSCDKALMVMQKTAQTESKVALVLIAGSGSLRSSGESGLAGEGDC